jgi:putative membrane protein
MNLLVKLIINALAVFFTAWLLPGVELESFTTALWVSILLSVLNVTLKPLLVLFTLPATIFTLGLFLLVINAVVILLADNMASGFAVRNFWWALLFSLVLSGVSSFLTRLGEDEKRRS